MFFCLFTNEMRNEQLFENWNHCCSPSFKCKPQWMRVRSCAHYHTFLHHLFKCKTEKGKHKKMKNLKNFSACRYFEHVIHLYPVEFRVSLLTAVLLLRCWQILYARTQLELFIQCSGRRCCATLQSKLIMRKLQVFFLLMLALLRARDNRLAKRTKLV